MLTAFVGTSRWPRGRAGGLARGDPEPAGEAPDAGGRGTRVERIRARARKWLWVFPFGGSRFFPKRAVGPKKVFSMFGFSLGPER